MASWEGDDSELERVESMACETIAPMAIVAASKNKITPGTYLIPNNPHPKPQTSHHASNSPLVVQQALDDGSGSHKQLLGIAQGPRSPFELRDCCRDVVNG